MLIFMGSAKETKLCVESSSIKVENLGKRFLRLRQFADVYFRLIEKVLSGGIYWSVRNKNCLKMLDTKGASGKIQIYR